MTRRALVFGGGGVLGFAWLVGAVGALEVEAGFDAREADLVVGTSAGSILAAQLGCGIGVDQLRRHHQGVPGPDDLPISFEYAEHGRPPLPRPRLGSPALLAQVVRRQRDASLKTSLLGAVPPGRGSLSEVGNMIAAISGATGHDRLWPTRPRPWVCTTDYRTGRRAVFGHDELAPTSEVSLADAVVASCSIPGWYEPRLIAGRTYVDGGSVSNASADLVVGAEVDEVFILAPMAALERDRPRSLVTRIERMVRAGVTRTILRDAERLRAEGKRVAVVTPGREDLHTMGGNLMNPTRRAEVLETASRTASIQLRTQLASRPWRRRGLDPSRASA